MHTTRYPEPRQGSFARKPRPVISSPVNSSRRSPAFTVFSDIGRKAMCRPVSARHRCRCAAVQAADCCESVRLVTRTLERCRLHRERMPGCDVANGEVAGPSPDPVMTNPLSSSFTKPDSHSLFGAVPTMTKSARDSTTRLAPVFTSRMLTPSRCSAPCNALTSAPYSIVMPGSASSRLER